MEATRPPAIIVRASHHIYPKRTGFADRRRRVSLLPFQVQESKQDALGRRRGFRTWTFQKRKKTGAEHVLGPGPYRTVELSAVYGAGST